MSEAARALGISQPAISKSIRLLEENLQLQLFKRSGDKLYPSMEAQRLYPNVRRIFDEINATSELAKKLRTAEVGTIKVAATYAITAALLTETIQSFHQRRPLVDLQLMSLTPQQVVERVSNREVDVGFLHEPVNRADINQIALCDTDIVCALPPSHRLSEKTFISPADLVNETVISYGSEAYAGKLLRQRADEVGIPWKTSIVVNQTSVAIAMVSGGIGIAVVDSIALSKLQHEVSIKPFHPSVSLRLIAISPSSRPYSPLCRQFVETVAHVVARNAELSSGFHRPCEPLGSSSFPVASD
jgi:Transcriptional regulator